MPESEGGGGCRFLAEAAGGGLGCRRCETVAAGMEVEVSDADGGGSCNCVPASIGGGRNYRLQAETLGGGSGCSCFPKSAGADGGFRMLAEAGGGGLGCGWRWWLQVAGIGFRQVPGLQLYARI